MIVNVKMGEFKTLFFHVCPLLYVLAPSCRGWGSYI